MDTAVGSADMLLSLNLVPLDKTANAETLDDDRTANSLCLRVDNRAVTDASAADDVAGSADTLVFQSCDVQLSSAQAMFCDINVPSHSALYDITNTDLGSLFSWEVQTSAAEMAGEATAASQQQLHGTDSRSAFLLEDADFANGGRRSSRKKAYGRWGPLRAALATLEESEINTEESADAVAVSIDGRSTRGRLLQVPARASHFNTVGSGTLSCPHCNATFDSHAVYRRHCVLKHSDGCHVPCPYCMRSFRRPAGRDQHIRREHSRDRASTAATVASGSECSPMRPSLPEAPELSCTMCKRSYATVDALAAHLASPLHLRRRDDAETANSRNEAVATAQLLTAHHADVLRRCPYQCRLCDFQCSTAGGLVDHLKSQRHAEVTDRLIGPTWCQRCGFYSYDVSDVVTHVIKASEHYRAKVAAVGHLDGCLSLPCSAAKLCVISEKRSSVPCRHCNHRCHSATHLARHLKAVHSRAASPQRQLGDSASAAATDGDAAAAATVCRHCGWKARSRYNLVVHVRRRHTGERPFACWRCRVAFADKYSLTVHYRTRKHKKAVLSDCCRLPARSLGKRQPLTPRSSKAPTGAIEPSASQPAARGAPPKDVQDEESSTDCRWAANPSSERNLAVATIATSPSMMSTRPQRLAVRLRCRHCSHRADSNRAMRQHYIERHAAASARPQRQNGGWQQHQQQQQQPLSRAGGVRGTHSRTGKPDRAKSTTTVATNGNRDARHSSSKPSDDDLLPSVGQKCDHCGEVVVGEVADFEEHKLLHLCATRECELSETERIGPLHAEFLRQCRRTTAQQLRGGRSRHREAPDLACPECAALCDSGDSMVVHMRLHSGHRPYTCVVCYKRFAEGQLLAGHLREHCTKLPSRRGQPTAAPPPQQQPSMLLASGESAKGVAVTSSDGEQQPSTRPVSSSRKRGDRQLCTVVGCGKTFRDHRGLAVHLRRHRGEKPYACDQCDYQCASPSERSRHRKVHGSTGDRGPAAASCCATASRSHSCDYCPYVAASAYHLRRHVRVHTGCKPYCCPHCDYRCNTEHNLRKHVLNSGRHRGLAVYRCPLDLPAVAGGHSGSSIEPTVPSAAIVPATMPPPLAQLCSFSCNLAVELTEHVRRQHCDQPDVVQRAASSAARFCGLLNSADDIGSVPEGSLVLPSRRRTADFAGRSCSTGNREQR